jgi:hypothetical protein
VIGGLALSKFTASPFRIGFIAEEPSTYTWCVSVLQFTVVWAVAGKATPIAKANPAAKIGARAAGKRTLILIRYSVLPATPS